METATAKKDVYQIVTERIIEQLQQNKVPWQKPWTEAGVPQNLITRRPYRGINVMLLALQDYPLNYFLTFKQLKELGGTVIKGEKAHIVVFWKWVDEENEETGETVKRAFLRYHMVFNIAQCEHIPIEKIPLVEKPNDPIEECEEIVNSAAYIQGWLERLKNDKRFIVYASVQAQKAVDYILNTKPKEIASSIKENSSVPA